MNKIIFKKDNIGLGKKKACGLHVFFLIQGNGNIIINKSPGEIYLQYNLTYLNNAWDPFKKIKFRN